VKAMTEGTPERASTSGAVLLAAAVIVAASIAGAGYWIAGSLDRASDAMEDLQVATIELAEQFEAVRGGARAAVPGPERAARPGPPREAEVDIAGAPVWGPESAKITVVEFSDFECPFCSRVLPTLQRLRQEYGDDLRVVFKHLPLSIHARARGAHLASVAAQRQGKFWEMHNKMFEHQRLLSEAQYVEWARELGLDVAKFEADMKSPEVAAIVDRDLAHASELNVSGTPAFFINGRFLSGAQPYPEFKRVVDELLARPGA